MAILSKLLQVILTSFLFLAVISTTCPAADCDEFVSWVAPAKNAYQKIHRIYPVPDIYKELAVRYMPRIWIHPESWQPIDFDDYLAQSRLVRIKYNLVFDWSGLAAKISCLSRLGAWLSGGDLRRWHRLDIHYHLWKKRGWKRGTVETDFHSPRASAGGFCRSTGTSPPPVGHLHWTGWTTGI